MNIPDQPLSPDILDELLSADLDGEFDRAAAELGFSPDAARTAMEAAPGVAARRSAITRARDLLSTQPELDKEREARLVTAALSAAAAERAAAPQTATPLRRHRSRNAWRALAGVGAAAAVIAGIVAVAATNPGVESKSSVSAKPLANGAITTTHPKSEASRALVFFGDVSTPGSIQAKVRDQLAQKANTPPPEVAIREAHPPAATTQSTLKEVIGAPYGADAATRASRAAINACITSLEKAAHLRAAPVLSGTGTSGAQPVFVVVFAKATTNVVYVLAPRDCSVIARYTVP